jgi:hypothetical protein
MKYKVRGTKFKFRATVRGIENEFDEQIMKIPKIKNTK